MDSNLTWLCRLCLKNSNELMNVFEIFQDLTIATVLMQHFWFRVDINDGYPEWVCKKCWIIVKKFHDLYERVKWLHRNYSVKLVGGETSPCSDLIKQEPSDSVTEAELEPDSMIVKCEETELLEQMIDMPINQEESHNYNDYNDDNSCNQSENEQMSDDEDQTSNKKRKSDRLSDNNNTENKTLSLDIKDESSSKDDLDETHQSEKDEEAAQIREFFTMKCDICSDVEFETLRIARKHYRTVHKKKRGHLTCCHKRFFSRRNILDHIKHHLNPNAFSCDQCGKRFKHAIGLKYHIKSHKTHSRSHKCSFCAKAFSTPSTLAYHIRLQHSLEKEQKFHCEKCNKNYPTEYALASHIRTVHELADAQVCEICAHVCKSKTIYRDHMQKHSGTTQPKVQCHICGAWLKNEGTLRKHLMLHEDDPVNCRICNKVMKKHKLKYHIASVHHTEKRHKCILCDKAFRAPKLLKEHMAVHTGQDLYKCAYCERTFKSGANMYSHRKKEHFEEWTRDSAKDIVVEKAPRSNDASLITTDSH